MSEEIPHEQDISFKIETLHRNVDPSLYRQTQLPLILVKQVLQPPPVQIMKFFNNKQFMLGTEHKSLVLHNNILTHLFFIKE